MRYYIFGETILKNTLVLKNAVMVNIIRSVTFAFHFQGK